MRDEGYLQLSLSFINHLLSSSLRSSCPLCLCGYCLLLYFDATRASMMVARKTITIRKKRFYPNPPEDVWAAITDAHALAEWLEPNNHKPVVGHKFQFRCD